MSMKDFEEACELIQRNKDHAFFAGPKPEELVSKAEQALGLSFPPTYRAFVSRLGCGSIAGEEFYGISKDDFENATVPNGIWLTLDERKSTRLPKSHIIVGSTGDGGDYAIDCSQSSGANEYPVVEWWPNMLQRVVAKDFGEFFLRTIRQALAHQ